MYVFDVSSIATIITLNIITLIFTITIFLMKFKSFIKIIINNDIEKKDSFTQLSEIIIDENDENILSKEVLKLLKDRIEYENSPGDKEYNIINDKLNIIDWRFICKCSSDKNVLELLKFNRNKIDWNELSGNENAIELLKERIECEKNLNKDEYNKLSKINWKKLSGNINAIEQLKERIEYEKTLTEKEYENLEENSKIDWYILSQNVNAIELLKANKDKIDWRFLVNLLEK